MMGDLIATAWNDALPLIMDDIAYFPEPYDNILDNIEDLIWSEKYIYEQRTKTKC